jgi:hypothetical protein
LTLIIQEQMFHGYSYSKQNESNLFTHQAGALTRRRDGLSQTTPTHLQEKHKVKTDVTIPLDTHWLPHTACHATTRMPDDEIQEGYGFAVEP